MKILEYEFRDKADQKVAGWNFSKVELKRINLFVGDTGTGKTRFLNTIFNLASQIVQKELNKSGYWKVKFSIGQKMFLLELKTTMDENAVTVVTSEEVSEITNSGQNKIVSRNPDNFLFNNKALPKLPLSSSCISLLKDEDSIKDIFEGFSTVLRRTFALSNNNAYLDYSVLPFSVLKRIEKEPDLNKLFHSNLNLNVKLFIVHKFFPKLFNEISNQYKSVFPFIEEMKVKDSIASEFDVPGLMPAFMIKEKNVESWVSLPEMSSGMQKVLMILSDLVLFPKSGIYLIDEYENSLGINAINFFPDMINMLEQDIQLILTSHHPYIINKIAVDNWYIFNRKGSNVEIKYGKELKERYSKSKQEAFVQLLNDKYYIKSIE